MYRKSDPHSVALFELKVGKNVSFLKKQCENGNYFPMYVHSFKFITPKSIFEAEKFSPAICDSNTLTTVSDKLRYYRYKKGLRQSDIADYLGIKRESYSSYERNVKDHYEPYMMDKISEILEVDVYSLLDDYNKFIYDGQGQYIKNLRKQLGITQKELAKLMNVKVYKVKKWEQGKVRMFKYTWENMVYISNRCLNKM